MGASSAILLTTYVCQNCDRILLLLTVVANNLHCKVVEVSRKLWREEIFNFIMQSLEITTLFLSRVAYLVLNACRKVHILPKYLLTQGSERIRVHKN